MQDVPDAPSTILVLAHSSYQARTAVRRIQQEGGGGTVSLDEASASQPWRISNKYYEADVAFHVHLLDQDDRATDSTLKDDWLERVPVVLYILAENSFAIPSSLRSVLAKMNAEIRLALRTPAGDGAAPLEDDISDAFDDIGLELVDEAIPQGDEEDPEDPAPLSPLAQLTQTLQTHLWPNLSLKTKAAPSIRPDQGLSSSPPSATASFPQVFAADSSFSSGLENQTHGFLSGEESEDDAFGEPQSAMADRKGQTLADEERDAGWEFRDALSANRTSPSSSKELPQPSLPSSLAPLAHPTRGFSDSFAPPPASGIAPPSSLALLGGLVPPPENGDPEEDLMDLERTFASLKGLREELGKVEDQDERRQLADRVVRELFGDDFD